MTTETETTESILRELAERPFGKAKANEGLTWEIIPDPRFEVLRGEHRIVYGDSVKPTMCLDCHWLEFHAYDPVNTREEKPPYCLRTDLGAIVRAAAACGFYRISFDINQEGKAACWFGSEDSDLAVETLNFGGTLELAAAKALREAVS